MTGSERLSLLVRVAEAYFLKNKSQSEIAEELGYSRSAISRLLTEARSSGVVEIKINYPQTRNNYLQNELLRTFGLRDALVVTAINPLDPVKSIAELAASYLTERLEPDMVLGISWGNIIYWLIRNMRSVNVSGLTVVQVIGSIGRGDTEIDGNAFVYQLGGLLRARCFPLNGPLIADSEASKRTFLEERSIGETLEIARRSDMVLVGVGTTVAVDSSLLRTGFITEAELKEIEAAGGVGNICGTFFDLNGRVVDHPINRRVVGIQLAELTDFRGSVIGMAGGNSKIHPILGALRGGYLDVLITDDVTATSVLEIHRQQQTTPEEI
jgi:DNA-binding transcriptional regulator LsrR (DeoR family)